MAFLLLVCVVAGCAPCRFTQLTLGVTLQRSAAPPFPSGPRVPPGAPYQNTLGAVPQDPLTPKLRLDTNDAKASSVRRRRYALKVPAAHFMWGNCKPIAGSHAVETMGWISSYLSRRPLPRYGGGGRGGGRCACGYFGSVSVRSTDDASASFVSSTASDRKGFVKGESVPLDRVLPTFARTKVGPRRVGVQMNTFYKTSQRL